MGCGNTLGVYCDLENKKKKSSNAKLKGNSQPLFRCHNLSLPLGFMANTSVSFIEECRTHTGTDLKSRLCFQRRSKQKTTVRVNQSLRANKNVYHQEVRTS